MYLQYFRPDTHDIHLLATVNTHSALLTSNLVIRYSSDKGSLKIFLEVSSLYVAKIDHLFLSFH